MGLFNRGSNKKAKEAQDEGREGETRMDKFMRRPGNTAFKQQRLKAWQPILTPKTVLPTFFVIGVLFAPIGGLYARFSCSCCLYDKADTLIRLLWGSNEVSIAFKRRFEGVSVECARTGQGVHDRLHQLREPNAQHHNVRNDANQRLHLPRRLKFALAASLAVPNQ